jgi:hypothetical protein
MATWTEVVELAHRMDEQRRRTGRIDEHWANQMVTMVLDLQSKLDSHPTTRETPASKRIL